MSTLPQIEAFKDLVQESVDRTVAGVETIHQRIVDAPFAAFEGSDYMDERVQKVRDAKTRAISSVYTTIRNINNDVGEMLSDLIGNVEDHQDAQDGIQRAEHKQEADAAVRAPKGGDARGNTASATPPSAT